MVRGLAADTSAPVLRLRRFAEVELGVSITIFFVAASMTSLPPAIDLTCDRVTLTEITERLVPKWPSLTSPSRDNLAFYEGRKTLEEERAENKPATLQAYVPGSGVPLPRNAHDVAWSEYNHHVAGVIVLIMGILVLMTSFAVFEWSVRNQAMRNDWARYVCPLLCALGGMMLPTHSHSIADAKELLLEMTHMPLAVFAIWSGWTRWLELRLNGRAQIVAGWPMADLLLPDRRHSFALSGNLRPA